MRQQYIWIAWIHSNQVSATDATTGGGKAFRIHARDAEAAAEEIAVQMMTPAAEWAAIQKQEAVAAAEEMVQMMTPEAVTAAEGVAIQVLAPAAAEEIAVQMMTPEAVTAAAGIAIQMPTLEGTSRQPAAVWV